MTAHTPNGESALPWGIGADCDDESAQIISAAGWHVATVAIDPVQETAALIVRAVNAHAQLVAACEEAARLIVTARKHFPKSVSHADRFELENANATITAALRTAGVIP